MMVVANLAALLRGLLHILLDVGEILLRTRQIAGLQIVAQCTHGL